jgi:N,N'-diacetyllegionaminate synthase
MGSPIKAPTPSELPVREVARRSVTLARNVSHNETLSEKDLTLLRPGNGIPPKDLEKVAGCKVKSDLPQWHTLQWSDIQQ